MLDIELCKSFNVHIKIPKTEQNINDLVNYCTKISQQLFQSIFTKIIFSIQQKLLENYLGPAWRPKQTQPTPWECPKCLSRYGFKKRGKRKRILKTSNGKIHFPLLQVTCCDCNKTFSPFPKLLGIQSRHQLTRELEQLVCSVVKDISYAKTAKIFNMLLNLNLSPRTIHKTVQQYGQQVKIVENLSNITRLESDSTKINASHNERGMNVHLSISVGKAHRCGKRTIREKTLAAIEVSNSPNKTKRLLKKAQIDQVIVDGHSGLESYIEEHKLPMTVQRCLWHIPRTTTHMLYLDGLSTTVGRKLTKPMRAFLFDESLSVERRLEKYDSLLNLFRNNHYHKACNFLENSRENLFTYKQFADQQLYGKTISVVERQMREVNRRMENGSRWTDIGAQNLLSLKFIEELNPKSYDYLWVNRKHHKSSFDVILS